MTNPLLEAALEYASIGWPIFPTRSDKTPYSTNGVLDATTNPKQIEEWWEKWPRANIALDCGGASLVVLDLDPGHDPALADSLPATTLRSTTPRGGRHLFYALSPGEIVAPSASKLAPHVDVRSFHSYVLLAPSRTEQGIYEWESFGKPAHRTDALIEQCNKGREKHRDRDEWLIEPDLPENIALATAWLRRDAKIAVEGAGGDAMAYATAAHLKSYGISQALAFDLMWEHWNPRCSPPWGPDDADHFEQKIENGYRYNTSPPGNITPAYHVAKSASLFKPIERNLPSGHELTAGRFRFVDRAGMAHISPPEWLINDCLPAGAYAMLFGSPGTFKTFLALDMALSIATGGFHSDGVWTGQVEKAGNVLFAVGEGRSALINRISAWERQHYGGEHAEGFILSDPVPNVAEDLGPFLDGALGMSKNGYSLIVLDTVGRAMQGLNENAQEHASKFTAMVERLQAELGGTVLALHHTGHKEGDRERGSTVFRADSDTSIRVDRSFGDSFTVSLTMTKQKDAPEWTKPKWAGLAKVQLAPDVISLAAVRMDEQKVPEEKPARKKKSVDPIKMEILEREVLKVLRANTLKTYSQKALAIVLADPDKGVGAGWSHIANNMLTALREHPESAARKAYDTDKQQWVGQRLGRV